MSTAPIRDQLSETERKFFDQSFRPFGLGFRPYRKVKAKLAHLAHAAFEQRLASLGPGDIVLDLGANVGDFTSALAETGADVIAFKRIPPPSQFWQSVLGRCPTSP